MKPRRSRAGHRDGQAPGHRDGQVRGTATVKCGAPRRSSAGHRDGQVRGTATVKCGAAQGRGSRWITPRRVRALTDSPISASSAAAWAAVLRRCRPPGWAVRRRGVAGRRRGGGRRRAGPAGAGAASGGHRRAAARLAARRAGLPGRWVGLPGHGSPAREPRRPAQVWTPPSRSRRGRRPANGACRYAGGDAGAAGRRAPQRDVARSPENMIAYREDRRRPLLVTPSSRFESNVPALLGKSEQKFETARRLSAYTLV